MSPLYSVVDTTRLPSHLWNLSLSPPTLPTPTIQTIFFKNRMALNNPGDNVEIPVAATKTFEPNATARAVFGADYEAELAVITRKDCKDVLAANALDCVLGYTAINDVSARWWQNNDNLQWSFAKSFDTHAPLGPVFVHKDELGDASGLHLQLLLNGKVVQDANTTDLIFGVRKIVEFITMGTTVEGGTVIATGTPPGTGLGDVKAGDVMTVSLEGVGNLTNPVVAQPAPVQPPLSLFHDDDQLVPVESPSSQPSTTNGRPPPLPAATRIIRFLDAAGTEHHGQPTDATLTAAHLIHGDIFGPRTLTGETAEVAKLLSPVRSTPAIYGVGCNYVGHCPIAINPNPQFPVRVMAMRP